MPSRSAPAGVELAVAVEVGKIGADKPAQQQIKQELAKMSAAAALTCTPCAR